MNGLNKNKEYQGVMSRIEELLQKATHLGGFEFLTTVEQELLRELSKIAESHEDNIPLMPIKPLNNLPDMLRYIMYEKEFKQNQLASELGVSEALISGLMNGKRKLTLELAKKLHQKLGVDAHFLLTVA